MIVLFRLDLIVFFMSLIMILVAGEFSNIKRIKRYTEAISDLGVISLALSVLLFFALEIEAICFGV